MEPNDDGKKGVHHPFVVWLGAGKITKIKWEGFNSAA
jgi:hypothetical protein